MKDASGDLEGRVNASFVDSALGAVDSGGSRFNRLMEPERIDSKFEGRDGKERNEQIQSRKCIF